MPDYFYKFTLLKVIKIKFSIVWNIAFWKDKNGDIKDIIAREENNLI